MVFAAYEPMRTEVIFRRLTPTTLATIDIFLSVNNKGPKGQQYRVSSPTHGMLLRISCKPCKKELSHPQQVKRANIMTNNLLNHQPICKVDAPSGFLLNARSRYARFFAEED